MDLSNIKIRRFLRAVIAALMDEERFAFQALIKIFGLDPNRVIDAGKYVWVNRKKPPISAIGYEEVPLKIIREIAENLRGKNSAITINNFLNYFKGGIGRTIPSKGMLSQREVLLTLLLDKLNKGYEDSAEISGDNLSGIYDAVNSAFKSKDYFELINNKEMQRRILEGVPFGRSFNKLASSYDSVLRNRMRVVLRYIDSL